MPMSIRVKCPNCSSLLTATDWHVGKCWPCPKCSADVPVDAPMADPASSPEPAAMDTKLNEESQRQKSARQPTIIDKYEEEYRSALAVMEQDVKALVRDGRVMAAVGL